MKTGKSVRMQSGKTERKQRKNNVKTTFEDLSKAWEPDPIFTAPTPSFDVPTPSFKPDKNE
mgnify:CR=1 FL=1